MSHEPASQEDEYFHKEDLEHLRRLKAQVEAERASAERQALKNLHFHRCGKCGGPMQMRVFKGLEIEVCADCGAVLLDPGELEQLVGADHAGVASWFTDFFHFTRNKR